VRRTAIRRARAVTERPTSHAVFRRWMPRRMRPYRVRAVRPERGGATTLELEADGHPGVRFEPGQQARVKAAGAPPEPLPFASSAERPAAPALTVDGLLPAIEPGARVHLARPHGSFGPPLPDAGYVLICERIGLAPVMSLLRTLADRSDRRALRLIAANRRWDDVPYREELDTLEHALRLRVCHVLSDPPDDWRGGRGQVDAALLRRTLPPDTSERNVVISGPPAMTDATRAALLGLGIPGPHIATWSA
jgi:ferredoxin-NADP reductase